ncbi:hypothetical protein C8R26_10560 [Nitrosomonas oligotropha]|uniref:Acyl-CoA thioesterase n=1 Tax=Nitrosomonas oligotropha TaxID=42354 RepID=A0A2T5I245_9PROT|nr:hypothetical protein [Nitrosomonas oligotropha]PTQ77889.1 hypothetical protein C8R26_10560 [Nitrosomonas oligotropha]
MVDSFIFKQPVFVDGLVSFYVNIIKIGRTSINADVLVYTQCENGKKVCIQVAETMLTNVSIDNNR